MKIVALIMEMYIKLMIAIINGMVQLGSMAVLAVGNLVAGVIDDHQTRKRQLARQEAAEHKAIAVQSLGYTYSAESESYINLANALERKAACEQDKVKCARLKRQAATAYRRAEQLASKSPDYVRRDLPA